MKYSPDEISAAHARLVEEIRTLVNAQRRTRTMEKELERSVRELSQVMRRAGVPPEKVVMAVKNAVYDAGMGPRLVRWDKTATEPVISNLVSWCVDSYYGDDSAGEFSADTSRETPAGARPVSDGS